MNALDRFGEPIDETDPEPPLHDPRCDGSGWISRNTDPAVPCLDCKPHLAPEVLRRATFDADQLRAEPRTEEPKDA